LSWLAIDENGVTFHDAAALRGKETYETEAAILAHCREGAGAMVIGRRGKIRSPLPVSNRTNGAAWAGAAWERCWG